MKIHPEIICDILRYFQNNTGSVCPFMLYCLQRFMPPGMEFCVRLSVVRPKKTGSAGVIFLIRDAAAGQPFLRYGK